MTFSIPESLEYNGIKVDLASESPERIQNAVNYLMAYGFGKSLQDSVAGLKKEMKDAGASEAEIAKAVASDMADRAEAILAGTVGTRGPRLSGPAAVRREVIESFFKGWAKSMADKGKALPTLKSRFNVTAKTATDEQKKAVADAVDAIKTKYAELNSAKIEEEVSRRLALQAAQLEIDLDADNLLDDVPAGEESDEGETEE